MLPVGNPEGVPADSQGRQRSGLGAAEESHSEKFVISGFAARRSGKGEESLSEVKLGRWKRMCSPYSIVQREKSESEWRSREKFATGQRGKSPNIKNGKNSVEVQGVGCS